MAERTVSVAVKMRLGNFLANARAGTKALGDFRHEAQRLSKEGRLDGFANGAAVAAAGLTVALGAMVKVTATFEAAMSRVSAATNAAGTELDALRQAAIEAGRTTAFSATEAAGAITELAKAGLSTQDILSGGLSGALSLAAAGELAVADAAEIAATAMVQFGLSGAQIPHVADLLAAGAGKAQGDVSDLAMALKQSGLVASQMGLSVEETTGALASFASAGLIGSDAGTSFKTMLMRLAAPTQGAADLMKDLGITTYDASGQFIGLAGFAGQLQSAFSGLTQQQRDQAMATIFGADAIRAANVLFRQGADGIQEWIDKVNDAGYAEDQARKKMDNLLGDLKKLRGALESALIESGGGANEALRDLTQTITGAVNWLGNMPPALQEAAVWTAALTTATLLLSAGWVKAAATISSARLLLEGMGVAGQKASAGIGKLGSFAGKLGVFGAAVAVAGLASSLASEGIARLLGFHYEIAARDIDLLAASLQDLAQTGRVTGELAKAFGDDLAGIADAAATASEAVAQTVELRKSFEELSGAQKAALTGATTYGDAIYEMAAAGDVSKFQDLDAALMKLANNGGPATAAFQDFAAKAEAAGLSTTDLIALLPQYSKSAQGANAANTGLAHGFGTAEGNAKLMSDGLVIAIGAGRTFTDVLKELHGAATAFARSEIDAEEAIDAFKEAIDASNGSMNIHNELGRDAKSAMLDTVDAAISAAQAKYEETGSVDAANDVYEDYIKQLRQSMLDAGMSKEAVDKLLDSYAKLPDSVFTEVKNSAKPADEDLHEYMESLDDIPTEKYTHIYVTKHYQQAHAENYEGRHGYKDGAVVDYFANGAENHVAQFAPAGAMRVWAEPETGGEAYIPLSPSKRSRSEQIWAEVGRRFGMFSPMRSMSGPENVTYNVNLRAYSERFSLSQVRSELAMQGAV